MASESPVGTRHAYEKKARDAPMAGVVKLLFALLTQEPINDGVSVRKIDSQSGLG